MGLFGLHLLFRKGILASKFLGIYLCLFCFRVLTSYFTTGGRLIEFPELALIQSPSHFLFGPIHFLFVYFILNPRQKFSPYFLLLFFPFAMHLVEMLPFYFGPLENKIQEIQLILSHKSLVNYPSRVLYLPPYVLSILKVSLTFIYSVFSLGLIFAFVKKHSKQTKQQNKWLLNWLFVDSSLGLISSVCSILYVFGIIGFNNLLFSYADLLMFLSSFGNLSVILLKPSLLDGSVFKSLVFRFHENLENGNAQNEIKDSDRAQWIASCLEEYFLAKKPFLDPSLRLEVVGEELKVSGRELSQTIQVIYQLNYPDFVNSWRINYILEQQKLDNDWMNYSQDMLAEMSGFGSRQGLHNAIKKIHNSTPAVFFQKKKEE